MARERMLFGVSQGNDVFILLVKGAAIESSCEEVSFNTGDLGLDGISEEEGIHVMECQPRWFPGGYEYPQDGEMTLDHNSEIRDPTDEEWEFIKKNDYRGLYDSWKDIKSLSEIRDAEEKAREAGGDTMSSTLGGFKMIK
jgi:hypothetical protein